MKLLECLSSALSNVYSHKMRSALTMLGIIIGISSVIMITAVGAGVKNSVFEVINTINKSMIQVYANTSSWDAQINLGDAEAIKGISNVSGVSAASEWWGMKLSLRVPGTTEEGSLLGADQSYGIMETVDIVKGRFISANDVENHSYVAVVKPSTAISVFGRVDCLGEKIELETYNGKEKFTIIGILKEDEESVLNQMISTPLTRALAVVPITTVIDIFNTDNAVDYLAVTVKDGFKTARTAREITDLLSVRHDGEDVYRAESMESQFDTIDGVLNAITGFVAFVAGISLFVGGVGVMNIMLVTVKERTREIGVRKSLGATRSAIKLQFVTEAAILSLIGGIIGLIIGGLGAMGIGAVISNLMSTSVVPVISGGIVTVAVCVSCFVGIIFGVYPAGKAAKLNPVEALRYE